MSSRPPLHGLKTQSGLIAIISVYKSFLDFDAIILRFCAGAVAMTGKIPREKQEPGPKETSSESDDILYAHGSC